MQLPQPELAADITSALKPTEEIASEDCMPASKKSLPQVHSVISCANLSKRGTKQAEESRY